mmetsp:Transcript_24238/g.47330  ORF Transcript_24238/g.47330 Transcript_24238/m.47330 type:complete len:131 (-) Transcript_24238:316-708(-)
MALQIMNAPEMVGITWIVSVEFQYSQPISHSHTVLHSGISLAESKEMHTFWCKACITASGDRECQSTAHKSTRRLPIPLPGESKEKLHSTGNRHIPSHASFSPRQNGWTPRNEKTSGDFLLSPYPIFDID